jgi:membrane protein YdbS with pleckstrin-like domain
MTDREPKALQSARARTEGRSRDTSFLHPNEKIVLRAEIHPGIYWKTMALFFVSILVMLKAFYLGAFLMLVSVIMYIFSQLTKHYLLLVLTDQRVLMRSGILNLETIQMHYNRIESVEIFWTPMGRILGYGTIMITGTGSRVTSIPFVANALEFRSKVDDLIYIQDEKPMKVEITNPGSTSS